MHDDDITYFETAFFPAFDTDRRGFCSYEWWGVIFSLCVCVFAKFSLLRVPVHGSHQVIDYCRGPRVLKHTSNDAFKVNSVQLVEEIDLLQ